MNIKIEFKFICSNSHPLGWLFYKINRISNGEEVEKLV